VSSSRALKILVLGEIAQLLNLYLFKRPMVIFEVRKQFMRDAVVDFETHKLDVTLCHGIQSFISK
jgi:hypothetical protein